MTPLLRTAPVAAPSGDVPDFEVRPGGTVTLKHPDGDAVAEVDGHFRVAAAVPDAAHGHATPARRWHASYGTDSPSGVRPMGRE